MEYERTAHRRLMSARLGAVRCLPDERVVHMAFLDEGVPPEAAVLNLMTREDVLGRFDADSELVRWLLHQMTTYTPESQAIIACSFDRKRVLSDVVWTERKR